MQLPGHRLLVASTAVGMVIMLTSNLIFPWPIHPGTAHWNDISMAILFPALLLLFWALVTLGWLVFRLDPGDKLVNRGPYRYVRHPFFLGMMVAFAGLALALNNWLAVAATLLILWPVLTLRAMREERELAHRFGQEWQIYRQTTYFLVPYVW